jgi:hypothetical protein
LRRWEAIALAALGLLLAVAAVTDVARRVHGERRLAADKGAYMVWHRARSQRPGFAIKIRYGKPYDEVCGSLEKKGNSLKCLELRAARPRPVVVGGYRLNRPAPGLRFLRTECFGSARRLGDCRSVVRRRL